MVAAILACSPTAPAAPTPTAPPPPPPTGTAPPPTATALPQPADKPTQAELPPATLLASGGNLNMRRGPGVGYNILAVLRNSEQGTIAARSEDGKWFYLEIPGQPGSSAWVNGESQYSSIQGDPSGAPVMIAEPAVPAYLRNCIFHPVMIQPGNVLLPEQFNAPDNKKQFNPGIYEGYDQNVEGYPKIFNVELREGKTIDITRDGLNNTYACP
jgi:hypothetical protein